MFMFGSWRYTTVVVRIETVVYIETVVLLGSWATPECTVDWQQTLVARLEGVWPVNRSTVKLRENIESGKVPW